VSQLYRTVLGVRLYRSASDVWTADGWSFRAAEGEREWWASSPSGQTHVAFSLAGAVRIMKSHQAGEARQ
jgi:hypothetical protein